MLNWVSGPIRRAVEHRTFPWWGKHNDGFGALDARNLLDHIGQQLLQHPAIDPYLQHVIPGAGHMMDSMIAASPAIREENFSFVFSSPRHIHERQQLIPSPPEDPGLIAGDNRAARAAIRSFTDREPYPWPVRPAACARPQEFDQHQVDCIELSHLDLLHCPARPGKAGRFRKLV